MNLWVVHVGKQTADGSVSGVELFTDEHTARVWADTQTGPLMSVVVQQKTVDNAAVQLTIEGNIMDSVEIAEINDLRHAVTQWNGVYEMFHIRSQHVSVDTSKAEFVMAEIKELSRWYGSPTLQAVDRLASKFEQYPLMHPPLDSEQTAEDFLGWLTDDVFDELVRLVDPMWLAVQTESSRRKDVGS